MPASGDVRGPGGRRQPSILTKRGEFLAAAKARRQATAGFLLQARRREPDEGGTEIVSGVRIGFTCSKKLGNAVARNRAKRRLRALARELMPELGRPGWDYVLVGRPEATASRGFADLLEDLRKALAAIHAPRAPRSEPRSEPRNESRESPLRPEAGA